MLATPMGPANLGHYPQGMIANYLAGRFGGFSNDFLVTKYRERDFVIFLPQWVQPEVLIRREGVCLGHYRLRCFACNPYRDAVRARLTYKVWIKLVNLPYECWAENRVSAIINGFGRYLRTDESSRSLLDFNFFKCQVAVDDPADISENLFITMGDIIVNVRVILVTRHPSEGMIGGSPSRVVTPTKTATKRTRRAGSSLGGSTWRRVRRKTVWWGPATLPTTVTLGTHPRSGTAEGQS